MENQSFDDKWNALFPHTYHKMALAPVVIGADGRAVPVTDESGDIRPLKNSYVVYRSDNLELGTVGPGFPMVQPDEIREIFRSVIDTGLVTLTRGSSDFCGGSSLIAFGEMKGATAEIVPGDFITGEIRMRSGFDGSAGIGGSFGMRQSRCSNQLPECQRAAMNLLLDQLLGTNLGASRNFGRSSTVISFTARHTKNVRKKLEGVRSGIEAAFESFRRSVEVFKSVAAKQATQAKLELYVRNFFEHTEPPAVDEERSPQFETKVNRVIELLDTQRGLELVPAARGTMWQGYSAVTEYLTHEAGRNEDTRLQSVLFGPNAEKSRKALALALQ